MDSVEMDSVEIILHHLQRGDEILFGRSHNGRSKIKIKYGPLRLLTKRVQVDEKTMGEIKNAIREGRRVRQECGRSKPAEKTGKF